MFNSFTSTIEESAKKVAGNWTRFESFAWSDHPEDAEKNWCIIYTSNRDSGILAKSNEKVINKVLEQFDDDAISESHNHWAVGHVDGWAVRVYHASGEVTEAFKALHKLAMRLADYPILDEDDYCSEEYHVTVKNIEQIACLKVKAGVPADWAEQCYSWFSNNYPIAIENSDDQGGYPNDEEMTKCLMSLGFIDEDVYDE